MSAIKAGEPVPGLPANLDLDAIKTKQQATWSAGDYGQVGVRLQIVGESICEAVDLLSTDKVLDVAAGNGNASLAAARRFADVTSTDYAPNLLTGSSSSGRTTAPPLKAFAALEDAGRQRLHDALVELLGKWNRSREALVVPGDYLEVVVRT